MQNINNNTCNFCEESLLTPYLHYNKLIEKTVKIYKKYNCMYSFNKLKLYVKLSLEFELYIKSNYLDIYKSLEPYYYSNITDKDCVYNLTQCFLYNKTKNKKNIIATCDFCNKLSCEFHVNYSGFQFYKCIFCDIQVAKCGWCNINLHTCYSCFSENKNINNKNINNNLEVYDLSEEMLFFLS